MDLWEPLILTSLISIDLNTNQMKSIKHKSQCSCQIRSRPASSEIGEILKRFHNPFQPGSVVLLSSQFIFESTYFEKYSVIVFVTEL